MKAWSGLLVALWASCALAAPPEVQKEVPAKVGQPVRLVVKTAGEIGFQQTFDDDDAFFDELVAKDGARRFMFQSNTPGRYPVVFWTPGEKAGVTATFVVGPAGGTVPGNPPTTPTDPPAAPGGPLYFMAIRPDGQPASPEYTRIMSLPAWGTLRAAGHSVADRTVSEAAALGVVVPPGTAMPCLVTLRIRPDRSWSDVVRGAVPLPSTEAAIIALPGGVR